MRTDTIFISNLYGKAHNTVFSFLYKQQCITSTITVSTRRLCDTLRLFGIHPTGLISSE